MANPGMNMKDPLVLKMIKKATTIGREARCTGISCRYCPFYIMEANGDRTSTCIKSASFLEEVGITEGEQEEMIVQFSKALLKIPIEEIEYNE